MLSGEGNDFARSYFDFRKGKYLSDYFGELQGNLWSGFQVPYTEENYQRMKSIIDRRYDEWKRSKTGK